MALTPWKIGVELELLAPRGATRADLAQRIAGAHPGARVRAAFHLESEPSKVPGTPVFHTLTLGFEVLDAADHVLARCVDDITLQHDLAREAAPRPGWYRIVSDDARLLRLAGQHVDPGAPLPEALAPLAKVFGTQLQPGPGGMVRVFDESGASVAIGAPLPGERERPCELVTPPLQGDRVDRLRALVGHATALGFTLPREAALHVHFDAAPLKDARVIRDLVRLFSTWRLPLRTLVGTNPHCTRLGPWPDGLLARVTEPDFSGLAWPAAAAALRALKPGKYHDFNLRNLAWALPDKDTFEVRLLPPTLDLTQLFASISLFEALLVAVVDADDSVLSLDPAADGALSSLIGALALDDQTRVWWSKRAVV